MQPSGNAAAEPQRVSLALVWHFRAFPINRCSASSFFHSTPPSPAVLQATRLLTVARIWRQSFTDAGADPNRIVVVATYLGASTIPYFFDTFKPSEQAEVDAIAVAGAFGPRSWNSNKPCYYNFNDIDWLRKNPNITYEKALNLTRSSVIHADLTHNAWASRLKAQGKRLLALQGRTWSCAPNTSHSALLLNKCHRAG